MLVGEVDGMHVRDILVDTGAARTMVHMALVSEEKLLGREVSIRCAHGDSVRYPLQGDGERKERALLLGCDSVRNTWSPPGLQ